MVSKVDIQKLKYKIKTKFPDSNLSAIIASLPDQMTFEEFIGAVGVWLNILDLEKQQVLSSSNSKIKESDWK